jgi:SAM-dependent methyltransferase
MMAPMLRASPSFQEQNSAGMAYQFVARDRCPACLSAARIILAEVPFDSDVLRPLLSRIYPSAPTSINGTYLVASCDGCGTLYQAQVGDGTLLREVYESWLDTGVDQVWAEQAEWLASYPKQSRDGHEIMTAAAVLGVRLADLKTLDYGMGHGLWARVSKGLGCNSYGFDLSERCTRIANSHGIETVASDEIGRGNFDFINTEQVMEHVTHVDDVMGRLTAGLRPGGLLKISVPAQNQVRAALSQMMAGHTPDPAALDPAFPFEHVNAFTPQGLESLGKRFGLRRVRPTRWQRFAFLRYPGSASARYGKNSLKELGRPFLSYEGVTNLTAWFKSPEP